MTLLDAPKFDAARDRRNTMILRVSARARCLCCSLFGGWWPGRPIDWPWNWNDYLFGRIAVNKFLTAVEANDLAKAYGIWTHDKNWQQHPAQHSDISLRALPGRLELHQPGQRIRRHQEPQDRARGPLWQWRAGGHPHQRPQERRARSGVRSPDRPAKLRAARREIVSGAVKTASSF